MRLTTQVWLSVMALGGLITLQPLVQAQEKKDEKPPVSPAPATPAIPANRPEMRAARVEARLKSMDRVLTLTDDQKAKIRPILEEEVKQFEEMQQDKTVPTQDRMKKFQEIREASQAKMNPLLTADQQAKLNRTQPGGGPRTPPAPAK